jgi:hypothetical protein
MAAGLAFAAGVSPQRRGHLGKLLSARLLLLVELWSLLRTEVGRLRLEGLLLGCFCKDGLFTGVPASLTVGAVKSIGATCAVLVFGPRLLRLGSGGNSSGHLEFLPLTANRVVSRSGCSAL